MKYSKKFKCITAVLLTFSFIFTTLLMPGMKVLAAEITTISWASGYPVMDKTTHPSGAANIKVKLNQTGKIYYVVMPAGSAAPLATEVKAGKGKSGAAAVSSGSATVSSANTEVNISLTGLPDTQIFEAFLVAEDADGHLQQAPVDVPISTSILAHYSFDGDARDDSGNSNDGSAVGAVSYAGGFSGQALNLNGSDYLKLPTSLLYSHSTFTVTMRFKTTQPGALLGYQNSEIGSQPSQYIPIIYIDNSGDLRAVLWLGSTDLKVNTGTVVNDNKWHKLTMTATAGSISLYVDNGATYTNSGTVSTLSMIYDQIGVAYSDSSRTGKTLTGPLYGGNCGLDYFTGLIDDVYILSEGIDSTQVSNLTSDAPPASNISATNSSGSSDSVTVTGLTTGDIVKVYDASSGGTLLNSGTVASGGTSVNVPLTLPGSGSSGSVYVAVQKSGSSTESPRTQVSYISEAAQAANDAIKQAKSLLPSSFTATSGTDTDFLSYLNSINNMSATGVTLSLTSYNANVADSGAITYTGSAASGNVLVSINKAGGTQDTLTIPVTVPALPKYIVTFDPNDGGATTSAQYISGSTIAQPSSPTRIGYDFTHWYTEPGCETLWDFGSGAMPAHAMSLFSGWSAHHWNLSFNYQGADGSNSTGSVPVTYGSPVGTLPQPTRTGYDFAGWFTLASGGAQVTASSNYLTDASTELFAHWSVKSYDVMFDSNQGSAVSGISAAFGATFAAPAAPTRTGYSFVGWYSDASLSSAWNFSTGTVPVGGILLHAKWTPNPYALHFNSESGSAQSDALAVFDSAVGSLPAPVRAGYDFKGWFTAPAGAGTQYTADTVYAAANDTTLYANWTAVPQINSQPSAPSSESIGEKAVLSVRADSADSGSIAYQWQRSTDGGKSWSSVSGAQGSFYTTVALTYADNGVQYRCVVLNTQNGATAITYSDAVTINVSSPAQSVRNRIDALPDPAAATDLQIENSAPDIKTAKQLYDTLDSADRNSVGDAKKDKLNQLINRLTALLVVKPTDPGTGITVNGIGTSVLLPELSDPNTGKVEVALHVTPFSSTQQPQNIRSAVALISGSGAQLLQAFDVSLLKSVYGVSGNLLSSNMIDDSDVVGNITVRIPIPESDLGISDLSIVYIDDNGNVIPLQSARVTENGIAYLQFVTSHFSEYAITAGKGTANPKTGDVGSSDAILWLLLTAFAGMAGLGSRKLAFPRREKIRP